jgi:hypothetical protein
VTNPGLPSASFSPETELLVCSSQVGANSERDPRVRELLGRGIDWDYLLQAAEAHGVMPLLYGLLNRLCPESVPSAVLEPLRDQYHHNALRNLFMAGELVKVLNLFEANGIIAIPFKGPTLAACAHGNLALRQFVDLDLLLRKRDLPRATELLAGQGYRSPLPIRSDQQASYLESIGQLPFVKQSGPIMVELHAALMPRGFAFAMEFERLVKRLKPIELGGKQVQTLCPGDLLLVLCAHGAKHLWICLGWIGDIARLLQRQDGLDWPQIQRQARELGVERMLHLGLFLALDLLGAPLPKELYARIQANGVIRALAGWVYQQLGRRDLRAANGWQSSLFHFRVRERLQDGLRYSLSLALAPTVADWTSLSLPAVCSFLYYLLRPVRLAMKYGRGLWASPKGVASN